MLMVPTMIGAILDHPRLNEFDVSSLETVFYGASPISPSRLKAAIEHFGPIFFQFYGQAEAITTVSIMRREEHDLSSDRRLASCGRPVREAAVRLLDADGSPVPDGKPGELCVRGPLLMSGYLNKPEETAEALRGGWLCIRAISRCVTQMAFYASSTAQKDLVMSPAASMFIPARWRMCSRSIRR